MNSLDESTLMQGNVLMPTIIIVAGTDSQVVIYYLKAYLLGLIFNYFFYTTFD